MATVRAFELALATLWDEGRISGELHLGTGEEAIVVGVAAHLREGDALALDHRPSPMLLLRGVDPRLLVDELLGRESGLCRGRGGHMHLFSPDHLAASSGIVGASGPLGAGLALAAKHLRRGTVAVSFFGDGAVNQGQLMEAMNLAVAWSLPQVFVCKDNGWAITTESETLTGGGIEARARGFGLEVTSVDGPLFARFGPERVIGAPISESGFLGAAVGAAMGGLRPLVEIMLVDFVAVAFSAVLNEMAKVEALSAGRWKVPLVVRATCGGGYGDGGQHEQNLWGTLAAIPGLCVVVPSNPGDARGLMASALAHPGPVIFLEHKLLSETWLEWMGRGGRSTVRFDVPEEGTCADLPASIVPVPLGQAATRRGGDALTLVSLGVGVHRALEAAERLAGEGIAAEVIDLRSVRPSTTRRSSPRSRRRAGFW